MPGGAMPSCQLAIWPCPAEPLSDDGTTRYRDKSSWRGETYQRAERDKYLAYQRAERDCSEPERS